MPQVEIILSQVKGEPILMWDAPEAEHKNVWSLPRDQRAAVFETREILAVNQKKQKDEQEQKELRTGNMIQHGALITKSWVPTLVSRHPSEKMVVF